MSLGEKLHFRLPEAKDPEPRWPAALAVLAVMAMYFFALPQKLTLGPAWLMPCVIGLLLLPTAISHQTGRHQLNVVFGTMMLGFLTLFIIASIAKLVYHLPRHDEAPVQMLISAASLWASNILVFASWYWRLDAGGPHARDQRPGHCMGSFLFPQMTMSDQDRVDAGHENWSPGFIDYLFLAFNTSTALSPADTAVLSRWAKGLMMLQSLISLSVIVLLAARAVNVL